MNNDNNLPEDEQKLNEALEPFKKINLEFQELEKEFVGVDRTEVYNYMEEKGINSVREAYNKMYGIESDSQPSEFIESMKKAFPLGEKEDSTKQSNSGYNGLRQKISDHLNRKREE